MARNKQPGIKRDPRLTEADKLVRRVNNYLKEATRLFGSQSTQLQYAESQLRSLVDPGMLRQVDGVTQISRTRRALSVIALGQGEQKALKKIDKQPTIKEERKRLLKQASEQRYQEELQKIEGLGLKGRMLEDAKKKAKERSRIRRQDQQAAIEQIAAVHRELNDILESALQALYAVVSETGNVEAVDDIRSISRGKWTTAADKQRMIDLAQEHLAEEQEIAASYFEEEGIDFEDIDDLWDLN